MNEFLTINPENKSGKIKLNDIVMQPVMDRLIGEIGKIFGAKAMAEGADFGELMNFAENAVDTLEIEIHSPGGSVLDGYTLYHEINSLRSRGVHVTATVNSLAASMASVICMACDVVRIVPGGRMMIHEVSQGIRGNADDLRKAAELCESMSEEIAEIYSNRTGKPLAEIRKMMKAETWMSAKEAVKAGFANQVFDIRGTTPKSTGMNLLKMIFPGNEAEISQVEAALAEVNSLRNDVATFSAEVSTLKADLTAKDETITEHLASIASRDETIADITGKLSAAEALATAKDSEIVTLTQAVETANASAAQRATEMLAAAGQPVPLPIEEAEASAKELTRAEFNALKPSQKSQFSIAGGKIKD